MESDRWMDAAMAASVSGEKKRQAQTQPSSSSGAVAGGAAQQPSALSPWQALMRMHRKLHVELLSDAADMAAACGGDVHAIVFCPGGSRAEYHTFHGAPIAAARAQAQAKRKREAQVAAALRGMVATDVSGMTVEEVEAHRRKLLALRATVVRKLQEKAASAANVAGGDDAGRSNKIRKIE